LHEVRALIATKLMGEVVHDNFGVGFAGEVIVRQLEKLGPQLREVRKLAVEGQAKPLPLATVMALKRLGIVQIVCAAGSVTNMADRSLTGVLPHYIVGLRLVAESKRFDDGPDLPVCIEDALALLVEGAETGRKLPAVLQVEQHEWHQPRRLLPS